MSKGERKNKFMETKRKNRFMEIGGAMVTGGAWSQGSMSEFPCH
jgi:hypothetical protein